MLIIGHRGAAGLEAENTIGSFTKAEECGVGMVETDLRIQNGEIVLSHDKTKADSRYPTLAELLASTRLPLNLEVKESGFEDEILERIKGFAYKVVITSYNPWVLKKIRALDGKIQLGPVIGRKWGLFLPILISILKTVNISWVTIDVALVNPKTMARMKELGFPVYVYTNDDPKIFNDPKVYQQLKDLGVAGIYTDYPNIVSKFN